MTERIGDWVIETPIGAGGMGTVYRCHNVLTPRIKAAVKIIRPDKPEAFRARFLREVEALESLHHPAVVRVKGWGEQDGMLWLAMDLVEGTDLEDALQDGPLSLDAAVAVFKDVASGLAHAHERSVAHRDVKPANILITPEGHGRIVDFGIAMQDGRTRLTSAGGMSGTPAYMAPEVFGGKPRGEMLDIYALGQALYESLTGGVAFPQPEGLTTTQQLAHVAGLKMQTGPLDPGDQFPDAIRELIRQATDPQPARRIPNMRAFADALAGGPLPPREGASDTMHLDFTELPSAAPPPRKRAGLLTGAISAVVVMGLVLMTGLVVAAIAAFVLWPASTRPLDITLTQATPGTPTAVWVGRYRAEPVVGGTTWYAANVPAEPVTVRIITGEACDVAAWDGEDCLPCCACSETIAAASVTTLDVDLDEPDQTASVDITVPDLPDLWRLTAVSDTLAITETGRGTWRATGPAGTHVLFASAGTCPDVLGCGDDCPPGCSSVQSIVVLECGSAQTLALDLTAPQRPITPRRIGPVPAAPVASAPTTVITPRPAAPSTMARPSTVPKPPITIAPAPAPVMVPAAQVKPTSPSWTEPTHRSGWTRPGSRVPDPQPVSTAPSSLNDAQVRVRYATGDEERARIAMSWLQRRGANVEIEEYTRSDAASLWGRAYYPDADHASVASQATSAVSELGRHVRTQRDLRTGDDVVIYLAAP